MDRHSFTKPLLALALSALVLPHLQGDEGLLRSGKRVSGTIQLVGKRPVLGNSKGAYPLSSLDHVLLRGGDRVPPALLPITHVLHLQQGQRLTGRLESLDADKVRFHWAAGPQLTLPRTDLHALTHPRPFHVILPETAKSSWISDHKLIPGPEISGVSTVRCSTSEVVSPRWRTRAGRVRLLIGPRPGLKLAHVDIFMRTHGEANYCQLEIRPVQKQTGMWNFALANSAAGPPALQPAPLQLKGNWHVLQIDLGPDTWRCAIDDYVLASASARPGPFELSLKVRVTESDPMHQDGGIALTEPVAYRKENHKPLRRDDIGPGSRLEGVWLDRGDTFLGQVATMTPMQVHMAGPFGKRALSWPDIDGVFLPAKTRPLAPASIRLWLQSAVGWPEDVIDAKLIDIDNESWTLQHDAFGKLTIHRSQCRRIQLAEAR